jgi:pyruvate/2-oxoglutarate dehydrogenase complex dihydrolipoamide acyltransferase (E2) component
MDTVVKRPVVVNDGIAIRSMMYLSLSFDHRVLDGLQAARFLGALKQRLENWAPDTSAY